MPHPSPATLLPEAKKYFRKHGRASLPWRTERSAYRILVSEVMLQQTQVERVIPFYIRFVKQFGTAKSLAGASLSEVLKLWQGLGYNRRGKLLRDAAIMIEREFHGRFPHRIREIECLPGVGPYTARAIAAFAFNQPEVFVETNIRTVFLYHCFFHHRGTVSDAALVPLIVETLHKSKMAPRDFYAALMDYGASLKKSGVRNNAKSKHYTKQSVFEGSRRQLRGEILKLLLQQPMTATQLQRESGRGLSEVEEELTRLQKEQLIISRRKEFLIPQ